MFEGQASEIGLIGVASISTVHKDYNDGIPLVCDWVNPVSCNDFLIKSPADWWCDFWRGGRWC